MASDSPQDAVALEPAANPAGTAPAPPTVSKTPATVPCAEPPLKRRNFFQWLTYGLGVAAAAAVGVPLIGYVFGIEKRKPIWVDLGKVDDFPVGETQVATFDNPLSTAWDGMTAHTKVYVRNNGKDGSGEITFLVLSVNCAHLGCPVSWFPQSGLFMCPCHGGVYYANGARASGPPPRGLFAYESRVLDGRLEVQAPHFPTISDPLKQKS